MNIISTQFFNQKRSHNTDDSRLEIYLSMHTWVLLVLTVFFLCSAIPALGNQLPADPQVSVSMLGTPDLNHSQVPSFTATLFNYNRFNQLQEDRSMVFMNETGVRIVDIRGENNTPHNEFIQNFNTNQIWLVSVERELFVPIPFQISDQPVNSAALGTGSDSQLGGAGIMTVKPCMVLSGRRVGRANWRGYDVDLWECRSSTGKLTKQNFSNDWGLVVREESADGSVSELRNLKSMEFPDRWFVPADKYRQVDLYEFVNGVPAITAYEEHSNFSDLINGE